MRRQPYREARLMKKPYGCPMPKITIVAELFKSSFEALSPFFNPREQEREISAKALMNERGRPRNPVASAIPSISFLSSSRVLKIDLPPEN